MNAKSSLALCTIFGFASLALAALGQTAPATAPLSLKAAPSPQAVIRYGQLPLSFEPNRGQTSGQVQWLARGPEYTLYLSGNDAVLQMNQISPARRDAVNTVDRQHDIHSAVVRMSLLGARAAQQTGGEDLQTGKVNYFTGNDPAQWQHELPMYGKVRMKGVYPGVDLVYYGHRGELEYDFVVAPGADAATIKLGFDGAKATLAANGDLVLPVDGGPEVRFNKPVVYQMKDGARQPVDGCFSLSSVTGQQQVSFQLGAYDHSRELVIDPTLLFVGALGSGQGNFESLAYGMAVDVAGEIILTGETGDVDFPVTAGALQTVCNTYSTAAASSGYVRCGSTQSSSGFVTKISADGTSLVYSTYLHGGGGAEYGYAVATDTAGDAYVLGMTSSNDFPITSDAIQKICQPYYPTIGFSNPPVFGSISPSCNGYFSGGGTEYTVNGPTLFISKLDPTGATLLYSTFFGGTQPTYPVALALDSSNNIYFTSFLQNAEPASNVYPNNGIIQFPVTTSAFQPFGLGEQAATLSKLSADGHTVLYSTLFGSGGSTNAHLTQPLALAVGPNGIAYVGGQTLSDSIPTTSGSVRPSCVEYSVYGGGPGRCASYTGFLSAFDTTQSGQASLAYSTYIGGPEIAGGNYAGQQVLGLAADSENNVYVTGFTLIPGFPTTTGAYQTTCPVLGNSGGCNTAFLSKINPSGSAYVWSTFFGGTSMSNSTGNAIALDTQGRVYLYGYDNNYGYDLPLVNPLEPRPGNGSSYAFVSVFSPDGAQLIFSSPLGNQSPSAANVYPVTNNGLALDSSGNVYFAAYGADWGSFATTSGTYATTAAGSGNRTYFGKISPILDPTITTLSISPSTTITSQTVTFTATMAGTTQATPKPTGTVTLLNTAVTPSATLGTISLGANGSGTFTTSSLAVGSYTVTATYSADTTYEVSTSTAQTLTINTPAAAAVSVTAPASATVGASITLTATVSASGGSPTGEVTFMDGASTLGSAALTNGSATYSTASLAIGSHNITVNYAGDNVFGSASSAVQAVVINGNAANATLTASPSTTVPGQTVTLTVVVTALTGTATPTGSVIFLDGTASLSSVQLASSQATLSTASLALGSHSITASYAGDSNFATATSAAQTVLIQAPAATTTTVSSSSASSNQGASVTLTAAITSAGVGSPTGSVTFYDGATTLGDGTVSSGSASYSTAALSAGSHSITAVFSGDTFFQTSTSAAFTQVVVAPGFTLSAAPTSLTIAKGASGSTVITLTPVGGFTGTINFACGTLPSLASCSFSPASLNVIAGGSGLASTLTVSTNGSTTVAMRHAPEMFPEVVAALLLLPLGFIRRIRRIKSSAWLGCLLLAGVCLAAGISGCGGSANPTTPVGSYTVPVTVTSGTTTATVSLSITVQ